MLTGSACLAARGVRDVHDLDVLVGYELWSQVHELDLEPLDAPPPQPIIDDETGIAHLPDDYEPRVIRQFVGFDFFTELPRMAKTIDWGLAWKSAQLIDGFYVISPRHCLAVKALANRDKDLTDIGTLAAIIMHEESP